MRGAFAFGSGVDNFAAAVDAVAAGEIFGVVGLTGFGINDYLAVLQFDGADLFESFEQTGLADGNDDGLSRDDLAVIAFDGVGGDVDGAGVPEEVDAGTAGVLVFEGESGHVGFGAAVKDGDVGCAEIFGGDGSVDGGVASADDDNFVANVHGFGVFIGGNEFKGVDNVACVFAGDAEGLRVRPGRCR